jgi:hypothetical protein
MPGSLYLQLGAISEMAGMCLGAELGDLDSSLQYGPHRDRPKDILSCGMS